MKTARQRAIEDFFGEGYEPLTYPGWEDDTYNSKDNGLISLNDLIKVYEAEGEA